MTDIYIRLSYDEYKEFERQLKRWKELEHTHYHGGYYHKSFRIKIGDIMLEVHGPQVKVNEGD
jgi:guanylate kinase